MVWALVLASECRSRRLFQVRDNDSDSNNNVYDNDVYN
jgi:hypothetical protein